MIEIPFINLLEELSRELPPIDFILPGFKRGSVGCIASAGGTGKSFWALEVAMGICSARANQALLNLDIKTHGKAVLLSAEDDRETLLHRCQAIWAHLDPATRQEIDENLRLGPVVGMLADIVDPKWQETTIHAGVGARLIIIDTLSRWNSLNELDNSDMARIISIFEMIAVKTGASVLFLHHTAKGMAREGRQDEQQAARGASALIDNSRWVAWLQGMSKEEAEDFSVQDRSKFVRYGTSKVNYGPKCEGLWLERKEEGVLVPADPWRLAPLSSPDKKGKKNNGWRHEF